MVRVLLVSGFGAFLLSVLSVLGLMALTFDGYRWSEAAEVPLDGRTHIVRLSPSETAMVWVYQPDRGRPCRFVDDKTADVLAVKRAAGYYWRPGGSAGPYVGTHTFLTGSGEVAVRCPDVEGVSPIHVEEAPWLPAFMAQFGSLVLVPGALALTGALLLGLAAVLAKRRASPA